MGIDTLKLQNLASLMVQQGQGAAYYNPVQRTQMEGLTSSLQGSIEAGAKKKAEEKAKKKQNKGIGKLVGTAGAVAAAPFTGGASLAYLPMAATAGDGLESMARGNIMQGATNIASAGASGYGMYTMDPGGMGHIPMDKNNKKMLGEMPVNPSVPPPPTPMAETQGTPSPMAPPVQVKSLPKPAMTAAPAMAKASTPDFSSGGFNLPAAALTSLATYGLASAGSHKQPIKLAPNSTPRGGGLANMGRPQVPMDGVPISVEEAKRRGFDDLQINALRKQGLISGPDPKNIALAGLAAVGGGLLAGGARNA